MKETEKQFIEAVYRHAVGGVKKDKNYVILPSPDNVQIAFVIAHERYFLEYMFDDDDEREQIRELFPLISIISSERRTIRFELNNELTVDELWDNIEQFVRIINASMKLKSNLLVVVGD